MKSLKESILSEMEDTIINGDTLSKRADFALDVKCDNFDDVVDTLNKFLNTKLKVSKSSATIKIRVLTGDKGLKLKDAKVVKFDIMGKGKIHKAATFKFILDSEINSLICQYITYYPYKDVRLPNGDTKTLFKSRLDDCKLNYQWGTSLWYWLADTNKRTGLKNLRLCNALLNINEYDE